MKYKHVSAYEARLKDRNMQDMPGDERALETMFSFFFVCTHKYVGVI